MIKRVCFSLNDSDVEKLDMICNALSIRRIDFIRNSINSNYAIVCKNPSLLDTLAELEKSQKALEKLQKELKLV